MPLFNTSASRTALMVDLDESFFVARERVLAEAGNDMRRAFGTAVADRVILRVLQTRPEFVSKETQAVIDRRAQAFVTEGVLIRKGKVNWIDRIFIKLFLMPLS